MSLSKVSYTLFVPLRGRIYATENFPELLNDQLALEIKNKINPSLLELDSVNQYTMLASAARNYNTDKLITEFIKNNPNSIIVNLGAGLDTAYSRIETKPKHWFELDLENVIDLRKEYIKEEKNHTYIKGSIFDNDWHNLIKSKNPDNILFIATGLFHYFKQEKIVNLLNGFNNSFDNYELVFDTVTKNGLKRSNKIVSKMGKGDALMYFYVNDIKDFLKEIDKPMSVIETNPFYKRTLSVIGAKLEFKTRLIMKISDILYMVKMYHLKKESDQ